jgi:hypothetical protein
MTVMTKTITAEQLAEAQARLDAVPPRSEPYADLLASFAWLPIASYDKAAAPVVLLRRDEHVCAGSWSEATLLAHHTDDHAATWRSAEEGTLEMPLQFEPEGFAVVNDETLFGFLAT